MLKSPSLGAGGLSISAPLSSAAFSSHPLEIGFDLTSLRLGGATAPNKSSDRKGKARELDIFDELDEARVPLDAWMDGGDDGRSSHEEHDGPAAGSSTTRAKSSVLTSQTSVYFPELSPDASSSETEWLMAASRRVTALEVIATSSGSPRVAVGCEDGSVVLFAPRRDAMDEDADLSKSTPPISSPSSPTPPAPPQIQLNSSPQLAGALGRRPRLSLGDRGNSFSSSYPRPSEVIADAFAWKLRTASAAPSVSVSLAEGGGVSGPGSVRHSVHGHGYHQHHRARKSSATVSISGMSSVSGAPGSPTTGGSTALPSAAIAQVSIGAAPLSPRMRNQSGAASGATSSLAQLAASPSSPRSHAARTARRTPPLSPPLSSPGSVSGVPFPSSAALEATVSDEGTAVDQQELGIIDERRRSKQEARARLEDLMHLDIDGDGVIGRPDSPCSGASSRSDGRLVHEDGEGTDKAGPRDSWTNLRPFICSQLPRSLEGGAVVAILPLGASYSRTSGAGSAVLILRKRGAATIVDTADGTVLASYEDIGDAVPLAYRAGEGEWVGCALLASGEGGKSETAVCWAKQGGLASVKLDRIGGDVQIVPSFILGSGGKVNQDLVVLPTTAGAGAEVVWFVSSSEDGDGSVEALRAPLEWNSNAAEASNGKPEADFVLGEVVEAGFVVGLQDFRAVHRWTPSQLSEGEVGERLVLCGKDRVFVCTLLDQAKISVVASLAAFKNIAAVVPSATATDVEAPSDVLIVFDAAGRREYALEKATAAEDPVPQGLTHILKLVAVSEDQPLAGTLPQVERACQVPPAAGGGVLSLHCPSQDTGRTLRGPSPGCATCWEGSGSLSPQDLQQPRVTCVLRMEKPEFVVLGFDNGIVVPRSLTAVTSGLLPTGPTNPLLQLHGAVTTLKVLRSGPGNKLLLAGTAWGVGAAWEVDANSQWRERGSWSLFASPVTAFVPLRSTSTEEESTTSTLRIAVVSANSPVAVLEFTEASPAGLFVLPGTRSPLETLATRGNEVLLRYRNGLGRLWLYEEKELRRSMDARTTNGVLADPGWTVWYPSASSDADTASASGFRSPVLLLDIRHEAKRATAALPPSLSKKDRRFLGLLDNSGGMSGAETPDERTSNGPKGKLEDIVFSTSTSAIERQLERSRFVLGLLNVWELDEDIDGILEEQLGVKRPTGAGTLAVKRAGGFAVAVSDPDRHQQPWAASPAASSERLLAIVCLLRSFLNFPDTERPASQAITFYATLLPDIARSTFVPPALDIFADYWLDSSLEVQQSARLLFGTYLHILPAEGVVALAESWRESLPSRVGDGGASGSESAKALLLTGLIASEKFKLLSPETLKDISDSVLIYSQNDHDPQHQAIATELCSRGFEIWQNYVDAMTLVRSIFLLATGQNAKAPQELRNLARQATLHVAGVNTPLFMTTLSFDILNSHTAEQRNATMKLLGFLVRKKPLILYTSLPRLAEAVVKSLDPTVRSLRETVQQTATVILNELVRTFPSIDFQHKTQRLAVGTPEGAAIVYDLKTATRLFVLEGHSQGITALSWSNDGRRLITVSLEESKLLVWKVGGGLFSMFSPPGAPPRQGIVATGETPHKTFDFNVGDDGNMPVGATLEAVGIEWINDRSARLRIRMAAITFDTS